MNLDDVSAAHPSLVTTGPDVDQGYDAWAVRQAIDDLPDDERSVVRLQHVEGLSHVEIADQLGVPVGTVKSAVVPRPSAPGRRARPPPPTRTRTHRRIRPAEPRTVTRCRTYSRMTGESMNDDDRIAYLAGEPTGSIDDIDERADLDALRALLADPGLWDEPAPTLEDAVVDAVASAAGTSATSATRPTLTTRLVPPPPAVATPTSRSSEPVAPVISMDQHRRRWIRPAAMLLSAAAAVVIVVAGATVLTNDDDTSESFSMALEPTEVLPAAKGSADLTKTNSGWRIELDATGLPASPTGSITRPGCATRRGRSSRSARSTRARTWCCGPASHRSCSPL